MATRIRRPRPSLIAAGPSIFAAAAVGVAAYLLGTPLPVAVAVAAVVAVLTTIWVVRRSPRSALKAIGAKPLKIDPTASDPSTNKSSASELSIINLVEGLCTTHGMKEPQLHIVESDAVNVASVGLRRRKAHLAYTRGALNTLNRLELEAVTTRQLCEIRRGQKAATVLAAVARIPGAGLITSSIAKRLGDQRSVITADLEAVRLTNYPPALVTALRKSVHAPTVGASNAAAHLWLVAPPAHRRKLRRPPILHRIAVLTDL